VHFIAGASQEESGLTGRIPPSDDADRLAGAGLRLHLTGGVVDPDTLELGQAVQRESVVASPGRDDDRPGRYGVPVLEADLMRFRIGGRGPRPERPA
jgi:hypothetical protein